jgi:hypothetical protein
MRMVVLAHGPGGMFDLLPFLFLGGAMFVIFTALRDGQDKKTTNTRTLPTSPFSRQVRAALRQQKPERSTEPSERGPRRIGGSPLQVIEGGEAGEKDRPRIPQRFEPAPPAARRKTS